MKTSYTRSIFNILQGFWSFSRTLSNNGLVKGQAIFKNIDGNTLFYTEAGVWHTSREEKFNVSRSYEYRYEPSEDVIFVHFTEGKKLLFHRMMFQSKADGASKEGEGEHLCKKDHYKATYTCYDHNRFKIVYRVIGPKKNYTSMTEFERVTPTPAILTGSYG